MAWLERRGAEKEVSPAAAPAAPVVQLQQNKNSSGSAPSLLQAPHGDVGLCLLRPKPRPPRRRAGRVPVQVSTIAVRVIHWIFAALGVMLDVLRALRSRHKPAARRAKARPYGRCHGRCIATTATAVTTATDAAEGRHATLACVPRVYAGCALELGVT